MSLQLKIINPLKYPEWDKLLLSTREYSFFHSSAWAKVLYDSYNYIPLYFTIFDANKIASMVPLMEIENNFEGKRGISLPFTDYCKLINREEINFGEILNAIIDYGKKSGWKYLEFRGESTTFNNIKPSSVYYYHKILLSASEDYMFSKFRGSTKRNIKRAIREGVEVKISNSFEAIKKYYQLHCNTRKAQGIPPQPFHFFVNIYKNIISENRGFVILAHYDGKIIAGKVFFHFGREAIFKYAGSNKAYLHLRPNNLIMWEAIKWFSKEGFKSIDFGRTELENDGLRRFKAGWGTSEYLIKYYKYDLRKDTFTIDRQRLNSIYKSAFRILPNWVLKAIGSLFYRYMG